METINVTLPQTKQVVTFKKFLTTGQSRELQRIIASKTKISPSKTGEGAIQDISVDVIFDTQDKSAEFLIVDIKDGEKTLLYTKEWLDELPVNDGQLVYSTLDGISSGSQLNEEAKKKS